MPRTPDIFGPVNSWDEFTAALASCSTTEAGTAFELVVRHYLTTDPIYQAKLAHVWLREEVPAEIGEKLGLPERDMGIDLIAQTHAGEFWAVQAKYRATPEDAREFARRLGLRDAAAWNAWWKETGRTLGNIPSNPQGTYRKKGWISWKDFLQPPAAPEL